tara:strand:+ start:191 stop:790 length:600 start_codon:yes stop_codon:yes gene_type:complete
MIEQEIFSTLILENNLNLDVKAMNDYAYELRKKGKVHKNQVASNIGGEHSSFVNLEEPVLQPLIKCITKMSYVYSNRLAVEEDFALAIDNMWFIINNYKDHNIQHTHPGSYLSGAFYSKAGEKCGNLVLKNPNPRIESYWSPKYFKHPTNFNNAFRHVTPQTNRIIIFPSWLEHYVQPNETKEDRIVWSFNLTLMQGNK